MSANDYWAKAQSGSPGTNLAEMQARLYAGEATQRMMEKFDRKNARSGQSFRLPCLAG